MNRTWLVILVLAAVILIGAAGWAVTGSRTASSTPSSLSGTTTPVSPAAAVSSTTLAVFNQKNAPKSQAPKTSTLSSASTGTDKQPAPVRQPSQPAVPPPPIPNTQTVCNTSLIRSNGLDNNQVITLDACSQANNLFASGRIAGNSGDAYDNRDALHVNLCDDWSPNPECPPDHRLFPQHSWIFSGSVGAFTGLRTGVTVGQASWAGFSEGYNKYSIAHKFYLSQSGADELYRQYTHGNIYVYPSLDDDKFAGDPTDPAVLANPTNLDRSTLNIANTPYVISSSQISKAGTDSYHIHNASGSDLPFIKLLFLGLASLKPDVKLALQNGPIVNGDRLSLLIPTVQMLLRHSHRTIGSEADYLSSQIVHRNMYMAHYLADGTPQPQYDSAKLVRLASNLTLADVPPLVRLSVVSENFTPNEKLFDTPGAIARNVSVNVSRTITVSAAKSTGLDGSISGHEYVWRLLDSDPSKASITVDPNDPSQATITFSSGSVTDRVDIGVFVRKQGASYYSVPGIISMHVHP